MSDVGLEALAASHPDPVVRRLADEGLKLLRTGDPPRTADRQAAEGDSVGDADAAQRSSSISTISTPDEKLTLFDRQSTTPRIALIWHGEANDQHAAAGRVACPEDMFYKARASA